MLYATKATRRFIQPSVRSDLATLKLLPFKPPLLHQKGLWITLAGVTAFSSTWALTLLAIRTLKRWRSKGKVAPGDTKPGSGSSVNPSLRLEGTGSLKRNEGQPSQRQAVASPFQS